MCHSSAWNTVTVVSYIILRSRHSPDLVCMLGYLNAVNDALKNHLTALARWLRWWERGPIHKKLSGLVPQ